MQEPRERTLTVEQTAGRLGVRINTVYMWLREGRLHGHKVDRVWHIEESSVLAQRRRMIRG